MLLYLFRYFLTLIFISVSMPSHADPRLIIHLTDYLANDYAGAVSEKGVIVSESEYREQVEFSKIISSEFSLDPNLSPDEILSRDIHSLGESIRKKELPQLVVPLARKVQKAVIKRSGISLAPRRWPDLKQGQKLYQINCIGCHGDTGRGDGPDGKDLDPPPANFKDLTRAALISPFSAFNTIRLGVPGTGMAAFGLSDAEVWALSFYVSSFRFKKQSDSRPISPEVFLQETATLNDQELEAFLKPKRGSLTVSSLRLFNSSRSTTTSLTRARHLLFESRKAFEVNNFAKARHLAIAAYFDGVEPVEEAISAHNPAKVTFLEGKMSAFRAAIENKDTQDLLRIESELSIFLTELEDKISPRRITPGVAFIAGFSILLREGFEAALIIMALLSVARATGSVLVPLSIHLGWVLSLAMGAVGWLLSGRLLGISGHDRELIEGLTSLFAVCVLVYVGFWMHRQTEIRRWNEFINVRIKNLVQAKNLIGLFVLSFIVTFREVIETVLFLRAIHAESSGDAHTSLLVGVVTALMVVIIAGILIMKFRKKVPLQHFFMLSASLMLILAVILSGKGVHALQEAGLLSVTNLNFLPRIEILGIFPSGEVISIQIFIATVCGLVWMKGRKKL